MKDRKDKEMKNVNCDFHGIVPATENLECEYCEAVEK
jgi:hypothetical protein